MLTETEQQDRKTKLDLFLADLSELSNKYGLYIGGCGCCGSPFITTSDDMFSNEDDLIWEHLRYTKSDNAYHMNPDDDE